MRGHAVDIHSIVVVTLHSPREKIWGEVVALNTSGVTVRGIDLNSFDDFVRQVRHPEGERVGLPTAFFPMQRVERISLDEPSGSIPSMADLFERKVGRSLKVVLRTFNVQNPHVRCPIRTFNVQGCTHPCAAGGHKSYAISLGAGLCFCPCSARRFPVSPGAVLPV